MKFRKHAFAAPKVGKLSEPTSIIYLKIRPIYSIIVAGAYWKEGNSFGVGNRKGNLAPHLLSRRLRSLRVIKRAGNIRIATVLSGIAMLLCAAGAVPAAEDLRAGGTVQPQGLRHAGIHDLKEMDATLDGAGVRFGVICRAFTYIGDQPQNDYRPAIEHRCFADSGFTFQDSAETPAAASPHSTAICSILFGEDPAAFHPKLGHFY